jgi:putative phosphoesterase
MKIALIGDIHANLPAFQAILAHINTQGVNAIWNVGDSIGYGPFPNEVLDLLQEKDILSIVGNYDLKSLSMPTRSNKWREKKHPLKLIAFQWAYDTLTPANRNYLRSLPEQRRLKILGKDVLLTHASPVSNKEYVGSSTSKKRLKELALASAADIVVCGHSHEPFAGKAKGVCFINTGSIGRPDDGNPRASYAILTLQKISVTVKHYRVEYNVKRTVKAIHTEQLPPEFAEMFIQGRSLNDVLKSE